MNNCQRSSKVFTQDTSKKTNFCLSVIIPVFNEAAAIGETIHRFATDTAVEIIVVDGGSSDRTTAIVNNFARDKPHVRLVTSPEKGRAKQMNYGATLATGELLLFLHGDTKLPANYQLVIKNTLQQGYILGAFELAIAGKDPGLKVIEWLVNLRSRFLSLPYGDQALFITKKNFQLLGGYQDLPIMEDFELVKRAKKRGKIAIAPMPVITSPRRWQKLGVWRTTLINQIVIIGYYLKISPAKLRNLYSYFD